MNITAVIPTKNRPADLEKAINSILMQRTLPQQLVIIDQSETDESRNRVVSLCVNASNLLLKYVHDAGIDGLVAAKAASLIWANGDLICFLEDDVVLEPDYFYEMEAGFLKNPDMLGCCGLVVDVGSMPSGYIFFFNIFHRGIFRDLRVGVHGSNPTRGGDLIPSPTLSGGLSAWRREVFDVVRFDTGNDFFMLEDIEFSTRAASVLGPRFYINPNARLDHRVSPVNRSRLSDRQRRKIREYLVFYKKRTQWQWATASLAWLLLGLFIESFFQAVRHGSPSLIQNYFLGILDGVRWRLRPS